MTRLSTSLQSVNITTMVFSLKNAILALFTAFIACVEEERTIYLVLMEGEPTAFVPGNSSTIDHPRSRDFDSQLLKAHARGLENHHDELLQSNLGKGSYNKLYSFKHVINGFAIHTTHSQAKILKGAPGVKLVERDRGAKMMTTYTPEFLGLPQGIWNQQGGERNAGDGIVIGFVDTGINPSHPSFANFFHSNSNFNRSSRLFAYSRFSGACETGPLFPVGSCNGKIVSARFFSAGAQASGSLNPSVDILSPFDAVGHGSHVASTAAGNAEVPVLVDGFFYGRANGMAPAARIAVYKAVYPTVGTMADVVAAIDQAIGDGVDMLTLSVGPDQPPQDRPTMLSAFDIAMLQARRAGVFVAQAAGNGGPSPSTVISFSPWVVGVGASTTDRTYPGSLILGNGVRIGGVGLSGPTLGNGAIQYKLVLAEDAVRSAGTFPRTPQNIEECQNPEALDFLSVQGSVVICTFSEGFYNQTSTITAILNTARVLGFSGFALVANPKYGDFIAEPIPWTIPGILIPKVADAQYYQAQTIRDERRVVTAFGGRAAIGDGRVAVFNGQRAPTVSRFSSRGPDFVDINKTPVDVLKPDIIAPGHQVWAAWSPISVSEAILRGHNSALLSGTSMATPHVVGIAALIKQHNPSWTPSMIASAMSTTARNFDNYGGVIMAEGFSAGSLTLTPSTPFDIGSGHIHPIRAIDPGLVLTTEYQDYINFLCSLPNISSAMVKAATGRLCTSPSGYPSDLNLPSLTISAMSGSRTVRRQVRNVGRTQETYLCAVLPPDGTRISLNPPWFAISPDGVQDLDIQIEVTQARSDFSFGEIVLTGSLNHIVRIPLVIRPVQ